MNTYVGLGLRKEFSADFLDKGILQPAFFEVAPENWMNIGGFWAKNFREVRDRFPVHAHGLSLSIGSPDALDRKFLSQVRSFLRDYDIRVYTEHLSFSKCDNAHLYDLLPIPFRRDAAQHVARRVQEVQDFLGMPLGLEIVSYYTPVAAEMSEVDFINEVVRLSGCGLLLDVNNVFVNAFNHGYDAFTFIDALPLDKVMYIHMAGHEQVSPDLIIDTHGQPIIDPVYDLFDYAISRLERPVPVLLERDYNIPELSELQAELDRLEGICAKNWSHEVAVA
ncbi:HvfB family MNIO-type RiPP peptide maturase [Dinghuibacter silviterrae]|uniref:Uncharacterized protein n=1 Tax=Dinghuibacter silviterrae TaxID=1539049 RepID=A0A4R8DQM5_9BACT|nr:DUF692 domain-containing protein [Dinghuibacter silviterrae]TDW99606.1 hypothetical protein EDB95_0616 [Dinghuibacter silviterrae]